MLSVLNLKSGDNMVDLGAGFGRMDLVLYKHFETSHFVWVEIVRARAEESMRAADPEFQLPSAQVYFIYNLSILSNIQTVIAILKRAFFKRARLCGRESPSHARSNRAQWALVVANGKAMAFDQLHGVSEPWIDESGFAVAIRWTRKLATIFRNKFPGRKINKPQTIANEKKYQKGYGNFRLSKPYEHRK